MDDGRGAITCMHGLVFRNVIWRFVYLSASFLFF